MRIQPDYMIDQVEMDNNYDFNHPSNAGLCGLFHLAMTVKFCFHVSLWSGRFSGRIKHFIFWLLGSMYRREVAEMAMKATL